jgi:hypothetical protein
VVTCHRGERRSELVEQPERAPEDRSRQWWHGIAVPGRRPRALLELLVIAAMFGAYKLGRIVAAKHVGTAFDNAYVVWDLERILRLADELSVQALMLKSTAVIKAANVYYVAVHFPATAAFLIWLYLRRPGDYLWVRRTLALLTASGLLVHLAIPVAPPRMLSALGFVDTAAVYGPAVYGPPAQNSLADQYAAMPSLHIGWAIMVALGIIMTTHSRWRWLAVLHPVATTFVVIGTGNHFWLDGMVAAGLLATSLVVVRSVTALTEPRIEVPDFVPVLASPALASPARPELPPPARPAFMPVPGRPAFVPAPPPPARSRPAFVAGLPDRLPPPVRGAPVAVAHRRRRRPSGRSGPSGPSGP